MYLVLGIGWFVLLSRRILLFPSFESGGREEKYDVPSTPKTVVYRGVLMSVSVGPRFMVYFTR